MTPLLPCSPRQTLGGYVFLPRIIDKVRLHSKGLLPHEYIANLLKPGLTADGRFLAFTGIDGEHLCNAILTLDTDEAILAWIISHSIPRSPTEIERWIKETEAFRPDQQMTQTRINAYPKLAKTIDLSKISIFDLIDMDEGRKPAV